MANAVGTVGSAVRTIWWLVLIRGILLVILGVLTLWQPVVSVFAIVLVFGIYAVVDGIATIVAGITTRKRNPDWGWVIAQGAIAVVAGVLILLLPGLAGLLGVFAILWFLVFSAIVSGIVTIWTAARQSGGTKGWGIAAGVVDIVFGVLLGVLALLNPIGTAEAIVWVVAILAIVLGVMLIVAAFQVRRGALTIADRIDEALGTEA